jgi:hypothetical protein
MLMKKLVSGVAAFAVAASALAGLTINAGAETTYDDNGIGEVLAGTKSGATVTPENFDAVTTDDDAGTSTPSYVPTSNGWEVLRNGKVSTDTTKLAVTSKAAAVSGVSGDKMLSVGTLTGDSHVITKLAFKNPVEHGTVNFSGYYIPGSGATTLSLMSTATITTAGKQYGAGRTGGDIVIAYGDSASTGYLYTNGQSVDGTGTIRGSSMYVKSLTADMDKGTLTYDIVPQTGDEMTGTLNLADDLADISCLYFTVGNQAGVTSYLDDLSLYSTMPTTRHAVTFSVTDASGSAVSGATVKVNGYRSVTTGDDGTAVAYLDEGALTYTVDSPSTAYSNITDAQDLTVASENDTVEITLQANNDETYYPFKLTVNDLVSASTLEGATVTIQKDGDEEPTALTAVDGEAGVYTVAAGLQIGEYTYSVSKDGYIGSTGTFTVVTADDKTAAQTVNANAYKIVADRTVVPETTAEKNETLIASGTATNSTNVLSPVTTGTVTASVDFLVKDGDSITFVPANSGSVGTSFVFSGADGKLTGKYFSSSNGTAFVSDLDSNKWYNLVMTATNYSDYIADVNVVLSSLSADGTATEVKKVTVGGRNLDAAFTGTKKNWAEFNVTSVAGTPYVKNAAAYTLPTTITVSGNATATGLPTKIGETANVKVTVTEGYDLVSVALDGVVLAANEDKTYTVQTANAESTLTVKTAPTPVTGTVENGVVVNGTEDYADDVATYFVGTFTPAVSYENPTIVWNVTDKEETPTTKEFTTTWDKVTVTGSTAIKFGLVVDGLNGGTATATMK